MTTTQPLTTRMVLDRMNLILNRIDSRGLSDVNEMLIYNLIEQHYYLTKLMGVVDEAA